MGKRFGKYSGISFTTLEVCNTYRSSSHRIFSVSRCTEKAPPAVIATSNCTFAINGSRGNSGVLPDSRQCGRPWLGGSRTSYKWAIREAVGRTWNSANHETEKIWWTKSWVTDKLLLRKWGVIESLFDFLKNMCQIKYPQHRSVTSFIVNIVSALVTYSFLHSKPSLGVTTLL